MSPTSKLCYHLHMWYVIWTATGRERKAIELIEDTCGDLTGRLFVPLRKVNIKRAGVWTTTDKALFPGYIFVDTGKPQELARRLHKIDGFHRLLEQDKEYQPLSEEETAFIEELYVKGGMFDPSVGIIEGDVIKITSGPLFGMEGYIKKIDRHKRTAGIELNMFGRTIKTIVGLEIIEKN